MAKRVFFILSLLLTASAAGAQSLAAFKDQLRQPDYEYGSMVTVTEHGAAASAVRSVSASRSVSDKVRGYRVRIFFDNSQTAREGASDTKKRFEQAYPDVPVYMDYKIPDFQVTVGNCRNREEAIILQNRIAGLFPSAFVRMEEIPLELFGEKIEVISSETAIDESDE